MTDGLMGNSFAPLRNVAAMLELIERMQGRLDGLPGMACFSGPSGFGKSTAATFSEIHFHAARVQVQSTWRAKKLVDAIARELNLKPARTVADIVEQICETLLQRDLPLIIDEADHLVDNGMVEIARDIYEATQVPVLLIGEELLPQKLQKFERVHGRMMDWVQAHPACAHDVKLLAPIYAYGVEIAPELQAAILKASAGSIRRVATNLAKMGEFGRTRQIRTLDLSHWTDESFQPVEAPTARSTSELRSVA